MLAMPELNGAGINRDLRVVDMSWLTLPGVLLSRISANVAVWWKIVTRAGIGCLLALRCGFLL